MMPVTVTDLVAAAIDKGAVSRVFVELAISSPSTLIILSV
jgi:hypothetical protein